MSDIHHVRQLPNLEHLRRDALPPYNYNEWFTHCGTWADASHVCYLFNGVTCMGCILANFQNQAENGRDSHE